MELAKPTYDKLKAMFAEGKRFDGRKLDEFREITITHPVSINAEGSARVKVGKTEVVAGVKMEVSTPYPDSLDEGTLLVSADLLPMASPRYEAGPPGFNAIELPRLVDRAIRESGMIDFSKLCIVKGEKVWSVIIDLYPINDDGNMVDAATIAAIAALKTAKMPGLTEEQKVDYKHRTDKPLPLSKEIAPFSFSFFKIGNSIILDPTREEEEACDVRITLGISKRDGDYMINSCQKSGDLTLSSTELEQISLSLPEKLDKLNEKLKKFLKA